LSGDHHGDSGLQHTVLWQSRIPQLQLVDVVRLGRVLDDLRRGSVHAPARSRQAEGGTGCHNETIETRSCDTSSGAFCLPQDCKWESWTEWSTCSRSCAGGQKKRNRHIKQSAQPGGHPCLADVMEEIEPCNMRSCSGENCVDGVWADWGPWQQCSQTCGGGLTWRSREVAVTATDCGAAALGPQQEVASCNKHVSCDADVDCEFNLWGDWSACTSTCHGMQSRQRGFSAGSGNGQWCSGALKEYTPCNPGPAEPNPVNCPVPGKRIDCEFFDWQEWGECSKTCGGGQARRQRLIKSKSMLGGAPCAGNMAETGPCSTSPCDATDIVADCEWRDWQDWGGCDKCSGVTFRARIISNHASAGGKPCAPADAKEAKACPRSCHDTFVCSWAAWSEWTACDRTCGRGRRKRERSLTATRMRRCPPQRQRCTRQRQRHTRQRQRHTGQRQRHTGQRQRPTRQRQRRTGQRRRQRGRPRGCTRPATTREPLE